MHPESAINTGTETTQLVALKIADTADDFKFKGPGGSNHICSKVHSVGAGKLSTLSGNFVHVHIRTGVLLAGWSFIDLEFEKTAGVHGQGRVRAAIHHHSARGGSESAAVAGEVACCPDRGIARETIGEGIGGGVVDVDPLVLEIQNATVHGQAGIGAVAPVGSDGAAEDIYRASVGEGHIAVEIHPAVVVGEVDDAAGIDVPGAEDTVVEEVAGGEGAREHVHGAGGPVVVVAGYHRGAAVDAQGSAGLVQLEDVEGLGVVDILVRSAVEDDPGGGALGEGVRADDVFPISGQRDVVGLGIEGSVFDAQLAFEGQGVDQLCDAGLAAGEVLEIAGSALQADVLAASIQDQGAVVPPEAVGGIAVVVHEVALEGDIAGVVVVEGVAAGIGEGVVDGEGLAAAADGEAGAGVFGDHEGVELGVGAVIGEIGGGQGAPHVEGAVAKLHVGAGGELGVAGHVDGGAVVGDVGGGAVFPEEAVAHLQVAGTAHGQLAVDDDVVLGDQVVAAADGDPGTGLDGEVAAIGKSGADHRFVGHVGDGDIRGHARHGGWIPV